MFKRYTGKTDMMAVRNWRQKKTVSFWKTVSNCPKWFTNHSGEIRGLTQVWEGAAREVGPLAIQPEPGKGPKAGLSVLKSC